MCYLITEWMSAGSVPILQKGWYLQYISVLIRAMFTVWPSFATVLTKQWFCLAMRIGLACCGRPAYLNLSFTLETWNCPIHWCQCSAQVLSAFSIDNELLNCWANTVLPICYLSIGWVGLCTYFLCTGRVCCCMCFSCSGPVCYWTCFLREDTVLNLVRLAKTDAKLRPPPPPPP